MTIFRFAPIAGAAVLAAASINAAAAAEVSGVWSTAGARAQVRIAPCGNELCGSIVALTQPNDPETGRPRTDKNNADPARRNRPLVGVQVLLGMKPDGQSKWTGRIYDAQNGKTVSGSISLNGARSLKLEGCALGGMICRSQAWTRIQ